MLTRINTAFSRDKQDGSHIHHHLLAQGKEVLDWLANGALLYVCGGQDTLGKSVEYTLFEIVKQQGGMSDDAVEEYIHSLRANGQYLRDVY